MAKCRQSIVLGIFFCLWCMLYGFQEAYPSTGNPANASNTGVQANALIQQVKQKTDSVQLLIGKGLYQQAGKLAGQNISMAGTANEWELVLQNYEKLIVIDSLTNNYQKAFEHLKGKEAVAQKLYAAQKEEIFRDAGEYKLKETLQQQIEETDDILKETEQGTQFRVRMIAIATIVVCLILTAGIIHAYRYNRKKRENGALSSENEQKKIQLEELSRLIDKYNEENQQLTQDNILLEKSNAVKDKLLSVISHDLRSPMSSLQALLSLFNTNNIARTDLVDFFGKLLSRVENTSTMLENLLHWSQYQLKGIEPIIDKVDIQKVIDECINLYRMQAEQKHIMIDNSLKTSVHVYADVEMLKITLRNLISNALKFTRSEGIITIKAMTKDNFAIVSVKDTGVGISPENQAKMFAMANFTTPGTEKEKGTGLGLMLCKDFVEHNHGKIWLDSKINVGTTFYFSIPLAEEKPEALVIEN